MSQELDQQAFLEAIDRIARTADGAILYRYLQKTLCGVSTDANTLNLHEGKRHHASELMGLMAAGIETHDRTDAIVVFRLRNAEPRDNSVRGAGRRIRADHYIPGFDDPADLAVANPSAGPA